MQYQTLLKRGLAVGGGFLAGKMISDKVISPLVTSQFSDLDPIAVDVGMALGLGAVAYFTYDMVPNRVLDGAVGYAGFSLIAPFLGGMMGGSGDGEGQDSGLLI